METDWGWCVFGGVWLSGGVWVSEHLGRCLGLSGGASGGPCDRPSSDRHLSPPFIYRTEKRASNTPVRTAEGSTMMKAGGSAPARRTPPAASLGQGRGRSDAGAVVTGWRPHLSLGWARPPPLLWHLGHALAQLP